MSSTCHGDGHVPGVIGDDRHGDAHHQGDIVIIQYHGHTQNMVLTIL